MKKTFIKCFSALLLATTIISSTANIVSANEVSPSIAKDVVSTDSSKDGQALLGIMSLEDKKAGEAKLALANEYSINTASTKINILTGYGSSKTIYVPFYVEKEGFFCGPAAALTAILAKKPSLATTGSTINNRRLLTQYTLSTDLGTTTNGTAFPGRWNYTMNKFLWENHYTALSGGSYSNWQATLKNAIIYTIDKGYPVIVDTQQNVGGIKLHPSYGYIDTRTSQKPTQHFIVVNGYNDTSGNDSMYITDNNSNPVVPACYWTSTRTLALVSKVYGLVY